MGKILLLAIISTLIDTSKSDGGYWHRKLLSSNEEVYGEHIGNKEGQYQYELINVNSIEMAAIGRAAVLGDLYDARSEKFLYGLSLFKSKISNNSIISAQNWETKLEYALDNNYEEKFRLFDISGELKLRILGGLFKLEGSGRYFKDTKRSARSGKVTLINSFTTEYEKISMTDNSVLPLINFDVLEKIDATHVVVGIQWGGRVFISVEDTKFDNKDVKTVEGRFGVKMKKLFSGLLDANAKANVNISDSQRNELNKFSFEIYGDVLPDSTPQTLIEAINFMKSSPSLVQKANSGKGKAIKYSLISVNVLRTLLKINTVINSIVKTIDEVSVKKCVKLFDDMNLMEQKINDLVADVEEMETYIETNKVEEIKNLQYNYSIYQTEVRRNLSEHLVLVRSGNETANKLEEVLLHSSEHPYAWVNIRLEEFGKLKQEISFIKLMMKMNVTMLNKDITLQQFLWINFHNDVYILFYIYERVESMDEEIMNVFRNMLEIKKVYGPKALFAAVSYDILNENKNNSMNKSKISLFRNGTLSVEDYVEYLRETEREKERQRQRENSLRNKLSLINEWKVLQKLYYNFKISIKILCVFGEQGNEVIFVTKDDLVYVFGYNNFGVLGINSGRIECPVKVDVLSNKGISKIAYGYTSVIALTESGDVYSWGNNAFGQIGNGFKKNESVSPYLISFKSNNRRIVDVCCGKFYSLVLTDFGEVYLWGGFLRDWFKLDRREILTPYKIDELNNKKVIAISCGYEHSMVLTESGEVLVFGPMKFDGQIITHRLINSDSVNITKIAAVSALYSYFLSSNGEIYFLSSIQVNNEQNKPVKISNSLKFKDIFYENLYFGIAVSVAISVDNKFYILKGGGYHAIRIPTETNFKSINEIYASFSLQITWKSGINLENLITTESLCRIPDLQESYYNRSKRQVNTRGNQCPYQGCPPESECKYSTGSNRNPKVIYCYIKRNNFNMPTKIMANIGPNHEEGESFNSNLNDQMIAMDANGYMDEYKYKDEQGQERSYESKNKDMKPRDDRGHLLPKALGGSAAGHNLAPQHPLLNKDTSFYGVRTSWSDMERLARDWISKCDRSCNNALDSCRWVQWQVEVEYSQLPHSYRPSGFSLIVKLYHRNDLQNEYQFHYNNEIYCTCVITEDTCIRPNPMQIRN